MVKFLKRRVVFRLLVFGLVLVLLGIAAAGCNTFTLVATKVFIRYDEMPEKTNTVAIIGRISGALLLLLGLALIALLLPSLVL